jgi:hypothetical protein
MTRKKTAPRALTAASMRESYARWAFTRYADLYRETGDGLFVWKAYQELRGAGMAVPESLLVEFDAIAERLMTANGAKEVARALQMAKHGGGPAGAARAEQLERLDTIVREVNTLMDTKGLKPEQAYRAAALNLRSGDYHPTPGHVKDEYLKWKAEARAQSALSATDTLATFGKR